MRRYPVMPLCNGIQLDDKPRKAGVCKGTPGPPAPALYGGNECRLRLRGGLLHNGLEVSQAVNVLIARPSTPSPQSIIPATAPAIFR